MGQREQQGRSDGEPVGGCQTHDYRAFGLRIRSDIACPELCGATFDQPDLTIVRKPTPSDFPPPDADLEYEPGPGFLKLMWPAAGCFRIIGHSVMEVESAPGVDDRLLAFPLLGPAMAVLLHLRGSLVLHGSALAISGSQAGVAFLGDKMAGKSTTAAAFVRAGHRLLTDDVLALSIDDGGDVGIEPAFPQIKLSEAAAETIRLENADALPRITPDFPKRQHRLNGRFLHDRIEPRRIYILKRGVRAAVRPLPPVEALGALMRFSYVKNIMKRMLTPELEQRHLQQIAALMRLAPVCELEVPGTIDRLGEAVAAVEQDLQATKVER